LHPEDSPRPLASRRCEALVNVSSSRINGHKLVWLLPLFGQRLEHLLGDVAALGDAAVQPTLLVVRLVGLGGVRRARDDAGLRPAVLPLECTHLLGREISCGVQGQACAQSVRAATEAEACGVVWRCVGCTAEDGHLYVHEHEVELRGAEAQATGKGGGCQLTPLEEERNALLACSEPAPAPMSASASGCTLRLRLGLRLRRKAQGFQVQSSAGPRAVFGGDHHAPLALVLQRKLRQGPNELLVVDRQHTA
jgi:hypothetical protein